MSELNYSKRWCTEWYYSVLQNHLKADMKKILGAVLFCTTLLFSNCANYYFYDNLTALRSL